MHPTLKEWQQKNKQKLQSPCIAWPTIMLAIVCTTLFIGVCFLSVNHFISFFSGFCLIIIIQFTVFTVLHDASHRSTSHNYFLNDSIGAVSGFMLSPLINIKMFRYVHMQHHRFTNENSEKDPDFWVAQGPKWRLPIKWMLLDLHYLAWYLPHFKTRPSKERLECALGLTISVSILLVLSLYGYGLWILYLWILPSRIALCLLVLVFDYLPHYPHDVPAINNKFQATNIKPNYFRLLSPLLLNQNYHLIHHLYPRVPFYKYHQIWEEARDPLLRSGARLMKWNGEDIIQKHATVQSQDST